jgi:hypothetical protein
MGVSIFLSGWQFAHLQNLLRWQILFRPILVVLVSKKNYAHGEGSEGPLKEATRFLRRSAARQKPRVALREPI